MSFVWFSRWRQVRGDYQGESVRTDCQVLIPYMLSGRVFALRVLWHHQLSSAQVISPTFVSFSSSHIRFSWFTRCFPKAYQHALIFPTSGTQAYTKQHLAWLHIPFLSPQVYCSPLKKILKYARCDSPPPTQACFHQGTFHIYLELLSPSSVRISITTLANMNLFV